MRFATGHIAAASLRDAECQIGRSATRGAPIAGVLISGLRLAAAGIATGLIAAVMGRRVVSSLLYRVSSTDAITLGTVAAILLLAAAAASWIPARNATAIGPARCSAATD